MSTTDKPVIEWQKADVQEWFRSNGLVSRIATRSERFINAVKNGKILLMISPSDIESMLLATENYSLPELDFAKEFQLAQRKLQLENLDSFIQLGYDPTTFLKDLPPSVLSSNHGFQRCSSPCTNQVTRPENLNYHYDRRIDDDSLIDEKSDVNCRLDKEHQRCTHHPQQSDGSDGEAPSGIAGIQALFTPHTGGHPGLAKSLPPEVWKAVVAMAYLFIVTWITAFVMVIVHDRVPDMKKYPPLPDIFLDNVPHIPWAFNMCEVTGTILLIVWIGVLLFHKHRFILLRRFFALSGTVFLLRCVTMLITSLSVPGSHLQCNPRTTVIGNDSQPYGDIWAKAHQAYLIWKGAGMSIQGVRTCGDYMFSGHTVALTMLNFFITEYTPRHLYFIHTFTWLLNMFGIFFILSAHEHYSIDVFVAFYITSRLFLYYHTLASHHRSLMRRDTGRTRIWFPLLAFFEASVDGTVPNEYEWPTLSSLLPGIPVSAIKEKVMLTVAQYMVWKNTGDSSVPGSANQQPNSHTVGHHETFKKTTKEEKVS